MNSIAYTPRVKWIVSLGGLLVAVLCAWPGTASARTWPAVIGEGSVSRWNDDRIAAYTLTIDDNHPEDVPFWLEQGEQYGFKWTWFLITGNVGRANGGTWGLWQSVVDAGHGIGSHGLTSYNDPPIDIEAEYRDSQQALRSNLSGVDALTLAYPNGYTPPNDSTLATQYYIAARGVSGAEPNQVGFMKYTNLYSVSSAQNFDNPAQWTQYYGTLLDPNGPGSGKFYGSWYSCHFHYVSGWESSISNMLEILQANQDDIWVGTFQQVAQYAREFESATLNIASVSDAEIRFSLTDSLDDTLFYFPLTVKFRIPSDWSAVSAVQNAAAVPAKLVTNGSNTYALVKAVPDAGDVTLQKVDSEGLLVIVRGLSKNRIWVDGAFSGSPSNGSYTAPFRTVQAGLDAASPGEIVTVREGTYREQITLSSGTPGQPLTLTAAPGERVVLNAMEPVTDWQAMTAGLYSKLTGWAPARLYSGFQRMPLAKEPDEGWWTIDGVTLNEAAQTFTITDMESLVGLSLSLSNASMYVWVQAADRFYTCPIVSQDLAAGWLEIEKTQDDLEIAPGDRYWLQNQRSLIDQPGEWAVEPEGSNFRIDYDPPNRDDLDKTQISPESGRVIFGQNAAHVRLNNLEIAGGADRGIYLVDVQDVQIDRCLIHDNVFYGVDLLRATDCSVKNSLFLNNRFGLSVSESTNLWIEGNEIGWNTEDGLLLTRGTSNVWVRNNYIHDHLLWGHPDNAQMYLGVSDVHFIGNLIMASGQSVMMEEAHGGEFSGNMVIGSEANMLNFGHGNASNFVIRGNTIALAGYLCLGLSARDYEVKENIFMTGHRAQAYTVAGVTNYQGDYNLFWNGGQMINPVILASDGAWHTDLADFQTATGQDMNSVNSDPLFVNAPFAYNVMDRGLLDQATRDTFMLRHTNVFTVGDHIEISFDGVLRTVTGKSGASITVDPPLPERPLKGGLIANWGTNTHFSLDLGFQPGSPAAGMGEAGGPIGSSVSILQYQHGDFDGDGRRDLPRLPRELER